MSDNFSTGNNNNPMISAAKGAAVGGVVGGASAYICGGYLKTSNNPLITDVNGFVLRCDKYAKALNKKYDRLTQKLESLQDKKALDEFISSEKIKVPDELLQDIKKADTNMAKEMLDFILQVDFDNALRKIFEKIPKHKFYMAYALVFSGIGALIAAPVAYFLNDKD